MPHKFHVLGVPVFTRILPSGDIAVWHPYNSAIREVVEPICRERGYWQSRYNNWIVQACYAEAVQAALASLEDAS
jgi:hypothetical protein